MVAGRYFSQQRQIPPLSTNGTQPAVPGDDHPKGEIMKLTKTLACSAAFLCLAASPVWAEDDPSLEEQETLILLEPVDVQDLYGVDEDGDGVADYLVLEFPEA
jgi:hypothetical protein